MEHITSNADEICDQVMDSLQEGDGEISQNNKMHKCRFCGKRFTHARDLERHDRTHTGEKPYKSDVCEKEFTQAEQLTSRIVNHIICAHLLHH